MNSKNPKALCRITLRLNLFTLRQLSLFSILIAEQKYKGGEKDRVMEGGEIAGYKYGGKVVVVAVYFILSRLLYLAFSANLGLLCMSHPGMGPLV